MSVSNAFLQHSGVDYPIICGPMYPCSNPELVAAVSEAGALGIIQPVSLTYVHGYAFIDGLRYIKSLTNKPVGMNLLIESHSRKYREKMQTWMTVALEEGVRFFITSMGKPDWVVRLAQQYGAIVYHDVTEYKWAHIAADLGVDGLIAVNNKAGGHVGDFDQQQLFYDINKFGLPIVCAGGIATPDSYSTAFVQGYQAVQMGTRFIASNECSASLEYKEAILHAQAHDIVKTQRITGVPVSVINNSYVMKKGLIPNKLEMTLLQSQKFKHLMRTLLGMKSLYRLKKSLSGGHENTDYWQAGKSVDGIDSILPVKSIIEMYISKG